MIRENIKKNCLIDSQKFRTTYEKNYKFILEIFFVAETTAPPSNTTGFSRAEETIK